MTRGSRNRIPSGTLPWLFLAISFSLHEHCLGGSIQAGVSHVALSIKVETGIYGGEQWANRFWFDAVQRSGLSAWSNKGGAGAFVPLTPTKVSTSLVTLSREPYRSGRAYEQLLAAPWGSARFDPMAMLLAVLGPEGSSFQAASFTGFHAFVYTPLTCGGNITVRLAAIKGIPQAGREPKTDPSQTVVAVLRCASDGRFSEGPRVVSRAGTVMVDLFLPGMCQCQEELPYVVHVGMVPPPSSLSPTEIQSRLDGVMKRALKWSSTWAFKELNTAAAALKPRWGASVDDVDAYLTLTKSDAEALASALKRLQSVRDELASVFVSGTAASLTCPRDLRGRPSEPFIWMVGSEGTPTTKQQIHTQLTCSGSIAAGSYALTAHGAPALCGCAH